MNEKFFTLNDHASIHCKSESTRYGFRHLASLFVDGSIVAKAKACYYNRTWESYEFQSVIRNLAEKVSGELSTLISDYAKLGGPAYKEAEKETDSMFSSIGAIAALGSLMTNTKKEANDWKARMLKAGIPALDIPDDWESLTEDEKESRLDKVIAELAPVA